MAHGISSSSKSESLSLGLSSCVPAGSQVGRTGDGVCRARSLQAEASRWNIGTRVAHTGDGVCVGDPSVEGEGDASGVGAAVLGSAECVSASRSFSSLSARNLGALQLRCFRAEPSRPPVETTLLIVGACVYVWNVRLSDTLCLNGSYNQSYNQMMKG